MNDIQVDNANQNLTKRSCCEYDLLQQDVMKLRKQNILNELEILKLTGKLIIFENQEMIAHNVVTAFKNRKIINIMVVSKTQSGKTGSMCATIKQYLEVSSNLIPIENIYIITGLSSCEWKEQTKERMPESVQSRVFHRCELPITFVEEIIDKKNILIIMDEIQVAAKKGQTIYKMFNKAGLLNKQKLYENDIKILEYTATPDGTIYDLMKWNDASAKILAEVGDGYISSYNLLQLGRVKQYKELCGYDKETDEVDDEIFENIKEIKKDIDNYTSPLYHIIRTKNGKEQDLTIQNFKQVFHLLSFNYINYDGESEIKDINEILIIKPRKHTFIFIKEMLRCAKTLKKIHIGILYDRCSKCPDDATIIQGLVGRDTGYDNNGISICYTNIDSIEKYEKLWASNFADTKIKWNSKTTKYTNGILSGEGTFIDPKNYDGFSIDSNDSNDSIESDVEEPKPIIKRKTFDEIKKWFIDNLKSKGYGTGPHIKTKDENDFYKCITQFDKQEKIRTISEFNIYEETQKWGFRGNTEKSKQKNKYRVYPAYSDETNPKSLEWWLIYY
jgi:hypothetical protein